MTRVLRVLFVFNPIQTGLFVVFFFFCFLGPGGGGILFAVILKVLLRLKGAKAESPPPSPYTHTLSLDSVKFEQLYWERQ